jgi:peptide/nickel transport system permease protein
VGVWLAASTVGPFVVQGDPNEQDLGAATQPPVWQAGGTRGHVLGTDHLGRDVALRVVHGARTSLVVGGVAVALSACVGTSVGLLSAEAGGWVDEVLMRVVDTQLAVPFILLAITILVLAGGSLLTMIAVLVLSGWVAFARVVRSEALRLREQDFVSAARALGAGRARVLRRHLWPNAAALVVVIATLELAGVIILESALSFLGVGVRPPRVSWGAMLADGREYLTVAWWMATLPGAAMTITILGVNTLGDWIRDLLDPRARAGIDP